MAAILDCLATYIFAMTHAWTKRYKHTRYEENPSHIFRDILLTSNFKISAVAAILENLWAQNRKTSGCYNQYHSYYNFQVNL